MDPRAPSRRPNKDLKRWPTSGTNVMPGVGSLSRRTLLSAAAATGGLAAFGLSRLGSASTTPKTVLASAGLALMPIVVGARATDRTRAAAATLAASLSRIAGASFVTEIGDGLSGIALGTSEQLPALNQIGNWDPSDPTRREDYLLRSHSGGVQLIGATDLAVEHAVWDFLHRMGYRQFFPGEHWEIVPRHDHLAVAIDVEERPDYFARRIWYGHGAWEYAEKPYADWCSKNRATSGIVLNTGHAYAGIIAKNKKIFEEHPEWLGLVNGARNSSKFCISNAALRQFVADYLVGVVDQDPTNPKFDSISIDPSDGGNWCECAECAELGSITDRAVTLANEVAAALTAKYPGKFVGMYAYNYHSAPPTILVHPAVVISVATAFIKDGLSVWDIIDGWAPKVMNLGIREYYSVNTWDRDRPGAARGSNLAYLQRTIGEFHAKGARFLSAESSDNWGPNGLGYYVASRLLWDTSERDAVAEIVEDFLDRAFSSAKEPMRAFYRQLDGSKPPLLASDQLGRMFRALREALEKADTEWVRARITDLLLYARYVDLLQRYLKAGGELRQNAFEGMIRHAYRMRSSMMVHTKALYRDLPTRDKTIVVPAGAQWNVPEGQNPWKSSTPFTAAELTTFLKEGISAYPVLEIDLEPVTYSSDLVPVGRLALPDAPAGKLGSARGRQIFLTYVGEVPTDLELRITGGLIPGLRDRGNVRVSVVKLGGVSESGEAETTVAEDQSTPPDGSSHLLSIRLWEPGLYRILIEDSKGRTSIECMSSLPFVLESGIDRPMNASYTDLWHLYFYVPKRVKTIGILGRGYGEVRDSKDRVVFWLNGRETNIYTFEVPEGEDGKVWNLRNARGAVRLIGVPPYLARSPASLLIPKEIALRDT